jgi:hypothetical protein
VSSSVCLCVGTAKGLFVCTSDDRARWQVRGPRLSGWEITGLWLDPRRPGRILVGTSHRAYGAGVRISDDLGESWRQVEHGPAFDAASGLAVERIWEIASGAATGDGAGTLWAGTEPAGLFVSHDGGENWRAVDRFNAHPTRPLWPGSACPQCVHSILTDGRDPERLWTAISSAGVLRTANAGTTWTIRNRGLPGRPAGDDLSFAHVQRVVQDPREPGALYLQHHDAGIFRSSDGGDSWASLNTGLPSRFGFALAVSPAGDLFAAPLVKPGRHFPDGRMRIYRLRRGHEAWHPLDNGLPGEPQFVGVLRQALDVDALDPAGIYFGTTEGQVFCSADVGETWRALPHRVGRVTSIRAGLLG